MQLDPGAHGGTRASNGGGEGNEDEWSDMNENKVPSLHKVLEDQAFELSSSAIQFLLTTCPISQRRRGSLHELRWQVAKFNHNSHHHHWS